MLTQVNICTNPIFVLGCPRSGTSILSHTISKHHDLWLSAESDFLLPLGDSLDLAYENGTSRGNLHWLVRQNVSQKEFGQFIAMGINALYTNRSEGKRWIEQTPAYALRIFEIANMFPNAQFVHILRDGRDVVNSMFHSNFGQKWSGNFNEACKTWKVYVEILLEFEQRNSQRILCVRNENLRKDPESVISEICSFLGIEPDRRQTEFIRSREGFNSSFKSQENTRSPSKKWSDTWDSKKKKMFLTICGETLELCGYSVDML